MHAKIVILIPKNASCVTVEILFGIQRTCD